MMRVMLIEDDPVMIDLLSTLLKIEGFEVSSIDFSMDLLDSLKQYHPDAILLDVHLRKPNGTEVSGFTILKDIRNDDFLKDMNVIMSSGIDFKERSSEEGADGFILKPYMPDALIKLIKQVIDSH